MSSKVVLTIDPYNDEHLRMIFDYEKENNQSSKTLKYLEDIRNKYTKEEFFIQQKTSNSINENLVLIENNKIKDSCYLQGEKDIKLCTMFFSPTSTRSLINKATNYSLENLGMEEVFVQINESEKNLKNNLEKLGFENIGNENDKIIFLKEKEETKRSEINHGYN